MMKYLLPLLTILLLPATVMAAPQLTAEAPLFHFGRIAEGNKTEHSFRFQNTGDAPLIISKVSSACGCTAALLSSKELLPGEWGEVKTVFNSKGYRGPVTLSIQVYSNDPDQPRTLFRLQGEVYNELRVMPARLKFSSSKDNRPFTATINLRNDGSSTLFLSDLKTTGEELQAELSDPRLAPGQTVQIVIRLTPRADRSRYAGYVTLRTSSPRTPSVRIPITAAMEAGN